MIPYAKAKLRSARPEHPEKLVAARTAPGGENHAHPGDGNSYVPPDPGTLPCRGHGKSCGSLPAAIQGPHERCLSCRRDRSGQSPRIRACPVPDQAVSEAAVRNDGLALEYVPEEMRTEDLCALAVKSNPKAEEFVPRSQGAGVASATDPACRPG